MGKETASKTKPSVYTLNTASVKTAFRFLFLEFKWHGRKLWNMPISIFMNRRIPMSFLSFWILVVLSNSSRDQRQPEEGIIMQKGVFSLTKSIHILHKRFLHCSTTHAVFPSFNGNTVIPPLCTPHSWSLCYRFTVLNCTIRKFSSLLHTVLTLVCGST